LRLRRRYRDRYLARGKFKGIEIQNPGHLTDRERARIERLSRRGPVAVLDPTTRVRDRFAVVGCFALDPARAAEADAEDAFTLAVTDAYRAAFVVDRGTWTPGVDWLRALGWNEDPPPLFTLG
jgi:hypothetical protein